jgi:DNA-binding NarL/FixJ family response regulator
MIKILIVEDDVNKREQLHKFIALKFEAAGVEDAESLIGGVRKLRSWNPDIVLLDMTLPNYDAEGEAFSGSMQAFGGEEFLSQCNRFNLNPRVIVVTQFETFGDANEAKDRDELDSDLKRMFPTIYCGMVYYHASLSAWMEELENLIRLALRNLLNDDYRDS